MRLHQLALMVVLTLGIMAGQGFVVWVVLDTLGR